jgi:cupin 2 domain-containing protein
LKAENIFSEIPGESGDELFETVIRTEGFKLERIISAGHRSPEGFWYDQEQEEWVILLRGRAGLRFEGEDEILEMNPGDYIHIRAHQRHRIEWTDPAGKTIWLAIHY